MLPESQDCVSKNEDGTIIFEGRLKHRHEYHPEGKNHKVTWDVDDALKFVQALDMSEFSLLTQCFIEKTRKHEYRGLVMSDDEYYENYQLKLNYYRKTRKHLRRSPNILLTTTGGYFLRRFDVNEEDVKQAVEAIEVNLHLKV